MFTVVDCETTGFSPQNHRIVQIAAVIVSGCGTIQSHFDTIVRPENPEEYEHGAQHIHGITPDQVRAGMPLRDALSQLHSFGSGNVFVAHNAPFDIGFIRAEAARVNMDHMFDTWLQHYLDTVRLSRRANGSLLTSHKLGALCDHYGIDPGTQHEALSDATATAQLLGLVLADLAVTSPDQLPELLAS